MRPRRPSRRRHTDAFLRELQRQRLLRIARRRADPVCEREQWFQWSIATGRRPRLSDYILPPLLFIAERQFSEDPNAS
ncbi:MAG: hypothetical protein EON88_33650 [Brevundimonas sp.]|nr:MAG: hypothetical protein EON88_33650 [Brevundimonas sp.]